MEHSSSTSIRLYRGPHTSTGQLFFSLKIRLVTLEKSSGLSGLDSVGISERASCKRREFLRMAGLGVVGEGELMAGLREELRHHAAELLIVIDEENRERGMFFGMFHG